MKPSLKSFAVFMSILAALLLLVYITYPAMAEELPEEFAGAVPDEYHPDADLGELPELDFELEELSAAPMGGSDSGRDRDTGEPNPDIMAEILELLRIIAGVEIAPAAAFIEEPFGLLQYMTFAAEAIRITDADAISALGYALDMKEPGWDAAYFYNESGGYILMYMFAAGTIPAPGGMTLGLKVFPDGSWQQAGIRWATPEYFGGGLLLSQSGDYADYYLESISDIKLGIHHSYWAVIALPDTPGGNSPRPFLTTPFEDYTVIEGMLLILIVMGTIAAMYHISRRFV